jgi:hypothetical protein
MPPTNLKEFNNEWVLFGLLFFSLMTFAIVFMASNGTNGLGDSKDKFDSYNSNMQSKLLSVEGTSNNLLNISAQNNPEVSDLGSKDSVATSYGIMGNSKQFLSSFKIFMGWILAGIAGQMLVSIFVGMFGLTALYFITKWIRQGS